MANNNLTGEKWVEGILRLIVDMNVSINNGFACELVTEEYFLQNIVQLANSKILLSDMK